MKSKRAFDGASIVAVGMVLMTVASGQSPETVPEALARGATGRIRSAPSGLAPSIEDVLRETDMIVRGIVGESKSYLSDDTVNVYTEYTLRNPSILYTTSTISSREPGPIQQVAVSQLGGTLVLNGQSFKQTENGLPPLEPGADVLLLLKRVDNRWHIAEMFFGAFVIKNAKLSPLVRGRFAEEFRDVEASAAIRQLVARIHTANKKK